MNTLRLASASPTRLLMLQAAGLTPEVSPARIDEAAVRRAMLAEGARPRDIAVALARLKAEQVGRRHPEALTLGADQVLDLDGQCLGKPETPEAAVAMLGALQGRSHRLQTAATVWQGDQAVWSHLATVPMRMRALSEGYIRGYVSRNWLQISHSAGAYQVEAEGIRLFSAIGSDYHAILGLPLVQLLNWLVLRGDIES